MSAPSAAGARWLPWLVALLALPPTTLLYAAAIGLGLHRHGTPWSVSLAATVAVFLPPTMVAVAARARALAFFAACGLWSVAALLALPVYTPGERREAVATGLALLLGGEAWEEVADRVAGSLPDEPSVATPELASAVVAAERALPPPLPVGDDEIVLPYEGEGRNLSIPVVFRHGDVEVEVLMMLDTGATYTTLPADVLDQLGLTVGPDAPVLRLHTANGERDANIVAVDEVWLGDLQIDHVAIATCDACRSSGNAGLLGLNVAGGFNVWIDADRHEVTFSRRLEHDRKLDVKPWLDLGARFSRYPGGRVEVTVDVHNGGARALDAASAQVRCGEQRWVVELGALAPGEQTQVRRKLPRHDLCEAYEISLHQVL